MDIPKSTISPFEPLSIPRFPEGAQCVFAVRKAFYEYDCTPLSKFHYNIDRLRLALESIAIDAGAWWADSERVVSGPDEYQFWVSYKVPGSHHEYLVWISWS